MLRLLNLSRSYGAIRALSGVSLTLHPGEVHALMGENGAGKSTLIRLLSGLERPDAGRMILGDRPAAFDSPAAAHAAGLRVLHQELHVVPALSVAENMHLATGCPARAGLIRWRALYAAASAALSRLRLTHIDPRTPMSRLGPGDRMLVRIAATLIGAEEDAPWLYILDEPTAALTGAEAERLFAVLAELKAQVAGILYVSHRMAEVLRLADRVSVLRDGCLMSSLPMAATGEAQIIHEMTGRDLSDLFPARNARAPAPPLLRVEGLSAPGIAGLTFDLAPGEVLGVAGLSGSGRGALLSALMGANARHSGTVTLDGRLFHPSSPADAWAAGLAHIPRERRSEGLMMQRALTENVSLPHLARIARAGLFQNRPGERAMLEETGRAVRLKAGGPSDHADTLSGGNQQKVLFARALAGNPRLLLLDEPTRGVDVGAKYDIYRLIRGLADRGIAVILASSDLPEVIGLADRIAILHHGRLAHLVPNDGLTEEGLLTLCYTAGEQAA
ncbi:MAG: sugar ABC transporter ATP-binding protein [Rubellimicrobium sp.]|nr:sugar ABC transporter ATP-binding protein [Rubellimicrobium sp.]